MSGYGETPKDREDRLYATDPEVMALQILDNLHNYLRGEALAWSADFVLQNPFHVEAYVEFCRLTGIPTDISEEEPTKKIQVESLDCELNRTIFTGFHKSDEGEPFKVAAHVNFSAENKRKEIPESRPISKSSIVDHLIQHQVFMIPPVTPDSPSETA